MQPQPAYSDGPPEPKKLVHAPEELTRGRLERLGEGIGKVVYASEHWVVKRERSPSAILALIAIWKILRKLEQILPARLGTRLVQRPASQIRFLRVLIQGLVALIPRSIWFATHAGKVWKLYRSRDARGEKLAHTYLSGTTLVPNRVTFPPTRVKVSGWPGWLTICEATERVEGTLHQRLTDLANAQRFEEVERWLDRFLDLRQAGWQRGLFSVDAHLKNFGVSGNRIVLLDAGGLTDRWAEIEDRLSFEEVAAEPHIRLGLGSVLAARPDIAARFNDRWKQTVNRARVRHHWPEESLRGSRPHGE